MSSKAIQLYQNKDPENSLKIISIEVPDPSPEEMQISVEYSGINFAEILARRGIYPEAPALPFIPGYEVLGRVTKTGSNVTSFTVGDRIVSGIRFGGYANCVNVKSYHAYKIPDDLDPAIALALVTQGVTAWIASREVTHIYPDDIVLIQSAGGGVGNLLVQLAKHNGAVVLGTTSSQNKLDQLSSIGVDVPLNNSSSNYFREISEFLGSNRRLDVVFDSMGGWHFKHAFRLLGAGGRMVSFGYAEALKYKSRLRFLKMLFDYGKFRPITFLAKSQSVCGVNILKLLDYKSERIVHAYGKMLELALAGKITPLIHRTYPAEEVHEAHNEMESRRAQGKIIIGW
jgi:2-desacetyl-2-hydroxyethyl bacteriochlorophyllide A dehydrogenase